jgi:PilZ domain
MDSRRLAQPPIAAAVGLAPRLQRLYYRHQIRSLAYLNLNQAQEDPTNENQANGGIIRNLGEAGIAIQAVAPLCANQQVSLRFDLANPRVRVEATGRVAWADRAGQAGIEFVALPQRSRRLLKEWLFVQLLAAAHQAIGEPDSVYRQSGEEALLFSASSRPAIRFKPAVTSVLPAEDDVLLRSPSLHLPWLPFPISAVALSWLVDGLILLSALLLFAVVGIAMIGAVPSWPTTLALGVGVAAVLTVVYRFLFFLLIGGTPGYCVAGRTTDPCEAKLRELDERPRFR